MNLDRQNGRIIGLVGIGIAAILAIGVADIKWFIAVLLAFLASLILIANTRQPPG
jgi:hypothetical protein